jgi:hypothetical protein
MLRRCACNSEETTYLPALICTFLLKQVMHLNTANQQHFNDIVVIILTTELDYLGFCMCLPIQIDYVNTSQ